ncbi:uncharacterized protein [Rutidosis leptorrhynchoides]|uniref:uncharacterized protein n=1 Tax=Rutidosis leptorrhynchoides TaxID=125765 RepID=UPI003A993D7C
MSDIFGMFQFGLTLVGVGENFFKCALSFVNSFFQKIGNGELTSVWFDSWANIGLLAIEKEDILNAGFDLDLKLQQLVVPVLHDHPDTVLWKDANDTIHEFSVRTVWESIRPMGNTVNWFAVVWFSQSIPKHAFLLWLLMGERLKTHDKLKTWESHNGMQLICPLCKGCPDSHDHLFFACPFAAKV